MVRRDSKISCFIHFSLLPHGAPRDRRPTFLRRNPPRASTRTGERGAPNCQGTPVSPAPWENRLPFEGGCTRFFLPRAGVCSPSVQISLGGLCHLPRRGEGRARGEKRKTGRKGAPARLSVSGLLYPWKTYSSVPPSSGWTVRWYTQPGSAAHWRAVGSSSWVSSTGSGGAAGSL